MSPGVAVSATRYNIQLILKPEIKSQGVLQALNELTCIISSLVTSKYKIMQCLVPIPIVTSCFGEYTSSADGNSAVARYTVCVPIQHANVIYTQILQTLLLILSHFCNSVFGTSFHACI